MNKKLTKALVIILVLCTLSFALIGCNDGGDPCTAHVDDNGDLKCDICSTDLTPNTDGGNTDGGNDDGGNDDTAIDDGKTQYTVTIVDAVGSVVPNVIVSFYKDGVKVGSRPSDNSGKAQIRLLPDSYTYSLMFTSGDYYYDESACSLSATEVESTVTIYGEVSSSNTMSLMLAGLGDEHPTAYVVKGKGGFRSSFTNTEKTYFVWIPSEAGKYKISFQADTGVRLNSCGIPDYVQEDICDEEDRIDRASFNYTVRAQYIGTGATEQEIAASTTRIVFSVQGIIGGGTGTLIIERTGDLDWDPSMDPWVEYIPATAPTKITLNESGIMTNVDIYTNSTAVYNPQDGYYHLNTIDGPVLYVLLNNTPDCIPSDGWVSFAHLAGNTLFGCYVYDEDGNYVRKQSYHQYLLDAIDCVDEATGLYPLTQGFAEGIKLYGNYYSWWDFKNDVHIFGTNAIGIVPEAAWLFACYYFA
ncbi:MAG: Ig-like domain-containing protein [Clostridia bacterium]|nr:Ig-like domain-containing protein [Clostridia bacterium]